MMYFNILAKIANLHFVKNVLKYYLTEYVSDAILDYGDHYIVVLHDRPGILFFKVETTLEKKTHFEVYIRSEGTVELLGVYYFIHKFPDSTSCKIKLVEKND